MAGSERRAGGGLRRWALTAAISLVLLEVTARLLVPRFENPLKSEFIQGTTRDRVPYAMFGKPPYVGPVPAAVKPSGEYRVFILGGSTVEQGDPPFSHFVEEELHQRGLPRAVVYNYGVVGSNSSQELTHLLFDVSGLQPDFVVMYDGANDFWEPYYGDPRPGYPVDFLVEDHNPLFTEVAGDVPLLSLAAWSSALGRWCCGAYLSRRLTHLEELRAQVGYGSRAWEDRIAQAYVGNHIRAYAVARAFGAKFLGVYQPLCFYKTTATDEERAMETHAVDHFQYARERVRAEFARARQQGLVGESSLVDLTDAFDGIRERVFMNSVHIFQPYQQVIGRKVAERIAALAAH